ncbi:MAG: lipid II flippase MurJ, partial [Paracoccus sp. (in: a-proteobacteria)]
AAVVLAGGAMVVLWLETAFAAWTGPGGVAMLEYSQRLGALLGNTLAMALTLVVFADLSRRSAAGETRELDARFNIAVWAGISLMLPVTVGVVVNAPGIIELVLGYGAFEAAEIRAEVVTLTRWMAVAPLGALVVRMLYVRVLADDTLPVVRIALVATIADMVIRAVLFRILVPWLGLTGIPLSLVITPIGPVLIIALWLRRQNVFLDLRPASISRPLMATSLTASLAIAAGAWLGPLLSQWTALDGKSAALSGLLVSGLAGSAVLGVAVTAFRVRLR